MQLGSSCVLVPLASNVDLRNPIKKFLSFKYEYNCIKMCFSNALEMVGRRVVFFKISMDHLS